MSVIISIIEEKKSTRESLRAFIDAVSDYQVKGIYNCIQEFKKIKINSFPQVVIMDIKCHEIYAIEAIREIKESCPDIHLIIYTGCEEQKMVYRCLCAGADGYILKSSSPIKLLKAIGQIVRGGAPMSPKIAKIVLDHLHKKHDFQISKYDFTSREKEVLQILVQGNSVKHIAGILEISFDTCRTHLRNIYKKLDVNCGKEAIAKILREKNILN